MAIAHKILGQSAPAVTTATDLYTVPAATQAVCSTLSICNMGIATTYRVSIRKAGAVQADMQYLAYDAVLAANDSILLTLGITLAAVDIVTVRSGSGQVAFQLFGAEIT